MLAKAFGLSWEYPDTWQLAHVRTHEAPRPLTGLVELWFMDPSKPTEWQVMLAGWNQSGLAGDVWTKCAVTAPFEEPDFHASVVRNYGLTLARALAEEDAWEEHRARAA